MYHVCRALQHAVDKSTVAVMLSLKKKRSLLKSSAEVEDSENTKVNMGTFAPGLKMYFRNVQKFRKKYARVHVVVSSMHQKFHPKKRNFCDLHKTQI